MFVEEREKKVYQTPIVTWHVFPPGYMIVKGKKSRILRRIPMKLKFGLLSNLRRNFLEILIEWIILLYLPEGQFFLGFQRENEKKSREGE